MKIRQFYDFIVYFNKNKCSCLILPFFIYLICFICYLITLDMTFVSHKMKYTYFKNTKLLGKNMFVIQFYYPTFIIFSFNKIMTN